MSRTTTGQCSTTLSKTIDDIDVEFSLVCQYRITPGSPAYYNKALGSWDPPEPPECEVFGCVCTDVTFHNGVAYKVPILGHNIQSHLGDFCLGTWADEIHDACYTDAYEASKGEE